jgi:hypothetical protein
VAVRDGLDGFAGATVTAVPPSQVQCSGGRVGCVVCTEPVTSEFDAEPGVDAMPRPLPAIPVEVDATLRLRVWATVAGRAAPGGGSWFDSTRPAGACATEPVTSPGPPFEVDFH